MQSKYTIYCITNNVNGLIYIGRTTRPLEVRWQAHRRSINVPKNQKLRLYQAFKKFGVDNFSIKAIDFADSFEELKKKEQDYILNLRSYDPSIGYNMSIDTGDGLEMLSKESIEKRRKSIHASHSAKKVGKHGIGIRKYRDIFYGAIAFDNEQYFIPAKTKEEAGEIHDHLAIYFYGKNAVLNFPEKRNLYSLEEVKNTYEKAIQIKNKPTNSKYFGVIKKEENKNRFYAQISKDKTIYNLGGYNSEEEAAKIVDMARVYLFRTRSKKFNFKEFAEELLKSPDSLKDWFENIFAKKRKMGISFDKRIQKYQSIVKVDEKLISIGYWRNPEDAAKHRDMAVLYFGTNDELNYPELEKYYLENAKIVIQKIFDSKKKFRGTFLIKRTGKFMSCLIVNGKMHKFGYFEKEEDAARAYDEGAKRLLGNKARLNFSDKA